MANKITTEGQVNPLLRGTLPAADNTPGAAEAPRTLRFAKREAVRLAAEKVFRLHARLFKELAK